MGMGTRVHVCVCVSGVFVCVPECEVRTPQTAVTEAGESM